MQRRRFLALGVTAFAGCMGSGDQTTTQTRSPTSSPSPTSTPTPTRAKTPTETATQTPTGGDVDVEQVQDEMVVSDGRSPPQIWVDVEITNIGSEPSGQVTVSIDWYDADGNWLGADGTAIPRLRVNEWWSARIFHTGHGVEASEIDDYSVNTRYEIQSPDFNPPEIGVVESQMTEINGEGVVEGRIQNGRNQYSRIAAVALFFEGDTVLFSSKKSEWVPPGDVWRVWIPYKFSNRSDLVTDADLYALDTN